MPIADITGGVLHYTVSGSPDSDPLLLLLPQSTGPVGISKVIDGWARRHRVIRYDQRGTGGSSAAPQHMSMTTQADDIIDLLDALDIDKASLLCHSTGCGIGIAAAARAPQRISSLVLVAPWTHADPHLSTMQNLRIAAARTLDPEQYAHFNAALLYPPEYRRAHQPGFSRLATEAIHAPQNAKQIAQRLNAILAFDARPLLPHIHVRTLVMSGKDDQLMPSWFAAETAQTLPNAQLVELEGGGHMLLETRPDDILDQVTAFLAEN